MSHLSSSTGALLTITVLTGVGLFLCPPACYAADATETQEEPVTSKNLRRDKNWAVLGNYAAVDVFIPGKKGLSLIAMDSDDKAWELEYLNADIKAPSYFRNLGSIEETRVSLLRRSFWGTNSFSGYFGLAYNSFSVSLGNETLSKLTGGSFPSKKILSIDTLGINTGIGNRWSFWKNATLGADWIGISQPLLKLRSESSVLDNSTNPDEKRRVQRVLDGATYFPRFYLFKFQFGMMF